MNSIRKETSPLLRPEKDDKVLGRKSVLSDWNDDDNKMERKANKLMPNFKDKSNSMS